MVYNPKIIDFFKRHNMYDEKMFDYLQKRSVMIDDNDPDQRMFIGFTTSRKNGVLQGFTICIPYMNSFETMLTSIHEISHGIYAYRKLNKEYNDNSSEVIAMIYEKLFVMELDSEVANKYLEYLDSLIDENSEEKYRMAIKYRDELIEECSSYPEIEEKCDELFKIEKPRRRIFKFFKS